MSDLPLAALLSSIVASALISGFIIVWFSKSRGAVSPRRDTQAVQASHTLPTARTGGLAIMASLTLAVLVKKTQTGDGISVPLLLSAVPVFAVGLAEDLGLFASPRRRLLAAGASAAIFVMLTGQWLQATDIPGFDQALQWAPIGIAFSILLSVGVSHAFNLIDGLNGLSGSTALASALALAYIAQGADLAVHRDILLILAAAVAGFLVFNFPLGKIFLGDAGAYAIGHLLVWLSISILWNSPNVTPLAVLLIFFWPIADTLLAITRRLCRGTPIAQPDRMHFHQLVMRGVEIVLLGRRKRRLANPLATTLTLPFILMPITAGALLQGDKAAAAAACAAFALLFMGTYKAGMWLAPKLRRNAAQRPQ